MATVDPADAKARLSELVGRAEAGDILRGGKRVARLVPAEAQRKPIDTAFFLEATDGMPQQPECGGVFVRKMRDEDLY